MSLLLWLEKAAILTAQLKCTLKSAYIRSTVRRYAPQQSEGIKRDLLSTKFEIRGVRHEPQASAAPCTTRSLKYLQAPRTSKEMNRSRGVLITAIMFEALGEHNPLLSDDRPY